MDEKENLSGMEKDVLISAKTVVVDMQELEFAEESIEHILGQANAAFELNEGQATQGMYSSMIKNAKQLLHFINKLGK